MLGSAQRGVRGAAHPEVGRAPPATDQGQRPRVGAGTLQGAGGNRKDTDGYVRILRYNLRSNDARIRVSCDRDGARAETASRRHQRREPETRERRGRTQQDAGGWSAQRRHAGAIAAEQKQQAVRSAAGLDGRHRSALSGGSAGCGRRGLACRLASTSFTRQEASAAD